MPANLTTSPDTWPPAGQRAAGPARKIIESCGVRMNIAQRLAGDIRSVSLDTLAGAVPLTVGLDVVLSVPAGTACAALRGRLPGCASATSGPLQGRFVSASRSTTRRDQITVRITRRTCSPGPPPGSACQSQSAPAGWPACMLPDDAWEAAIFIRSARP
jgi:hypothetical protein